MLDCLDSVVLVSLAMDLWQDKQDQTLEMTQQATVNLSHGLHHISHNTMATRLHWTVLTRKLRQAAL
jgi:hypothetical protein